MIQIVRQGDGNDDRADVESDDDVYVKGCLKTTSKTPKLIIVIKYSPMHCVKMYHLHVHVCHANIYIQRNIAGLHVYYYQRRI